MRRGAMWSWLDDSTSRYLFRGEGVTEEGEGHAREDWSASLDVPVVFILNLARFDSGENFELRFLNRSEELIALPRGLLGEGWDMSDDSDRPIGDKFDDSDRPIRERFVSE